MHNEKIKNGIVHSFSMLFIVLFYVVNFINAQELNKLTAFAYFNQNTCAYNSDDMRPKPEFPCESEAYLSKYARYFSSIGWDGICCIHGDWFVTSDFATDKLKDEWHTTLATLNCPGIDMDQNFIKTAIGYNNRWYNNAPHPCDYLLPLWNDDVRWSGLNSIFYKIGAFAFDIGADGFFVDNEKYPNKLLWTYLVEERCTRYGEVNGTEVVINVDPIQPGNLCRIVLINNEEPLFRFQWLAEVQNNETIILSDNNYVYIYAGEEAPLNNADYRIYTEPDVNITWTGYGSTPNGNYFVRFNSGINDNEECHVVYHNPVNNRHYEWIAITNLPPYGGEVVLQKQREKVYFGGLFQASTGIDRLFLYNVYGVTTNRYCKVTYNENGENYVWLTLVEPLITKGGIIKEMKIDKWNIVDGNPSSSFYSNINLINEDFTIESMGGGVSFTHTGIGTPNDGKYWIWGIPGDDPDFIPNETYCRVIYTNDNNDDIYVWNGDFLPFEENSWEIRISASNFDQLLSRYDLDPPSSEWYNDTHTSSSDHFHVCIDFNYNVDHNSVYFSLFNRQTVKDDVQKRAREMVQNMIDGSGGTISNIIAAKAESYQHELADEFVQGLIEGTQSRIGTITVANEQSYFNLKFNLADACTAIFNRFNPDPNHISFGVSPIQCGQRKLTPADFQTLFTNCNEINTHINWLYTTRRGEDWYFKSLQAGVEMNVEYPIEFGFTTVTTGTFGDNYYWIYNVDGVNVGNKVRALYENGTLFYVWDSVVWPVGITSTRQIRISPYNTIYGMGPDIEFYNSTSHSTSDFKVYRMESFVASDVTNASTGIERKWLHYINDDFFEAGDEYHIVYFDGLIQTTDKSGTHYVYYEWKYVPQYSDTQFVQLKIEPYNAVTGESYIQIAAPLEFYTTKDPLTTNNPDNYEIYKYIENDDFITVLQGGTLREFSTDDLNESLNPKVDNDLPKKFLLSNNCPNPFKNKTTFCYSIAKPRHASLCIYDITGRLVKTITKGIKKPGRYTATWDGHNNQNQKVAAGIYFMRLASGNFISVKKMLFLR